MLITNLYVARGSGSEAVVELLADGLRQAGHQPMLYAPTLGPQAVRMRSRGHVVVDRLAALPTRPDVLHLQHATPAAMALAAFPGVPAVFACHSALFEVEAPRLHPQIRFWVAVDDLCRDRCLSRGVPEDRLTVILNAVDMRRFLPRPALPAVPARGLMLTKTVGQQALLRAACAEAGIALDALGPATGRVSDRLEDELPQYDIVFATARMALEAAAVGCAVVVGDGRGYAGLLTSGNLDAWRRLNFGAGLLDRPMDAASLRAAIAAYDPTDTAIVTARLRAEAGAADYAAAHVALYAAALADPAPPTADLAGATASWLEDLLPSATPRAWQEVAGEVIGFAAAPLDHAVRGAVERLDAAIAGVAASQTAALAGAATMLADRQDAALATVATRLAEREAAELAAVVTTLTEREDAALAAAVATLAERQASNAAGMTGALAQEAAGLVDAIAAAAARQDAERAATETRLAAQLAELPGPRAERFLRAAWRHALPATLRRPLHRWRRRLLAVLSRP